MKHAFSTLRMKMEGPLRQSSYDLPYHLLHRSRFLIIPRLLFHCQGNLRYLSLHCLEFHRRHQQVHRHHIHNQSLDQESKVIITDQQRDYCPQAFQ